MISVLQFQIWWDLKSISLQHSSRRPACTFFHDESCCSCVNCLWTCPESWEQRTSSCVPDLSFWATGGWRLHSTKISTKKWAGNNFMQLKAINARSIMFSDRSSICTAQLPASLVLRQTVVINYARLNCHPMIAYFWVSGSHDGRNRTHGRTTTNAIWYIYCLLLHRSEKDLVLL